MGFVKSNVYGNNPQTIPELKEEIQSVFDNIQPDVFRAVQGKFKDRFIRRKGGYMLDFICHT